MRKWLWQAVAAIMASAMGVPAAAATVASIAELEKIAPEPDGTPIQVLGYHAPNDGGGGLFLWDAKSSATTDHCLTFASVGSGRWVRLRQGADLTVEQCGADDHGGQPGATRQAFQAAADLVLHSANPNTAIRFDGALYAFDGTPVTVAARYLCPRFRGAGAGTVIRLPQGNSQPAFRFSAASGARCGGGISDATISGDGVGVALNGVTGATVHLTIGAGIRIGALLCNCGPGQFTEDDDVRIDSDSLAPNQQTIALQVSGGNDSFAGDRLGGYVSLGAGERTRPVITVGTGAYWYNGAWDMNLHNIGGGGAATILANTSDNCAKASAGTLQIETTNQAPVNIATGCVYYGGTIYALGANNCLGILYAPSLTLARVTAIGPNGVQDARNADQHCLMQSFTGGSITLNDNQIAQSAVTYSVVVANADNSYNQTATFTLAWDPRGPGACSIASRASWAPTIDLHDWGAPEVSCNGRYPVISNSRWPTSMRFNAYYDVHAQ